MKDRFALRAGAFFGATGVACGAFGAHYLQARLAATGFRSVWETAAHYQLIHSVVLLACAALEPVLGNSRALFWAGRFIAAGILFFSASLYLLALGAPRWLGAITPLGGFSLIAGWGAIFVAGARRMES